METVSESSDSDGAPVTAAEKREMLDALALMIASTIDGAVTADVHEALASAGNELAEWRAVVQRRTEARRQGGDCVPAGPGMMKTTTTWECPKCGASQDIVDARKSLRRSSTSPTVKMLSGTCPPTICRACEEQSLKNEPTLEGISKKRVK